MLRGVEKSDVEWERGEEWGRAAADWFVRKFRGDEKGGRNILVFVSEALHLPPPRLTFSQH